jgi:regulator of telomere elongation helicase 1
MDACLKCWRSSGVWSRLQAHKAPLIEPRESSQLKACIAAFDAAIASGKGAVLLAVCRGKVSEGVDFADARARAVIITGIPFPPAKDPKVELKRRHLDKPMHGRDKADAHRLKGTPHTHLLTPFLSPWISVY